MQGARRGAGHTDAECRDGEAVGGARHEVHWSGGGACIPAGEVPRGDGRAAWGEIGGVMIDRFPLGYNTYCLRALRWHDLPLIEYATAMKLDAIMLQDSLDPGTNDPAHWKVVKEAAAKAGLWLGTGGGAVLPKDA